jgi:hypothetical protein
MTDLGERTQEHGGQSSEATAGDGRSGGAHSRRGFLRTSAAVVSLAGLGAAGGAGFRGVEATAQAADVPSYADFVPADGQFVAENGAVEVGSFDIGTYLEALRTEGDGEGSETVPFQLEPLPLNVFAGSTSFALLEQLGFGGPIPVVSAPAEEAISDLNTDRVTSIVDVTVYAGSYDTDAIAGTVEESDLTESDTSGVFVGPDPRFGGTQADQVVAVTWTSEYVISGPSVDLVATVDDTAQGQAPRLHEQNETVARQFADAGHGAFTTTSFTSDPPLQVNEDNAQFGIDYSPVETAQLQGYTQSLAVDLDDAVITATTVFSHESEAAVDEDVLSAVGSETGESTLSRDGRFVTVESTYPDVIPEDSGDGTDDGGAGDGGGDDGTGDGGGDDGTGDGGGDDGAGDGDGDDDGTGDGGGDDGSDGGMDDGADDGSDGDGDDGGTDDGSDGDGDGGSGDGLGPGFGPLSALTGLGGAGYLLSQRLGADTGADDEQ